MDRSDVCFRDIDTTRQYLNPDEALKRQAVNRLTLSL